MIFDTNARAHSKSNQYLGDICGWVIQFLGVRSKIVIVSLEGVITKHALRLKFPATNNKAEYEAIIAGLKITKELSVQDLKNYGNSQLIIG